jgi:hypothetical protein
MAAPIAPPTPVTMATRFGSADFGFVSILGVM